MSDDDSTRLARIEAKLDDLAERRKPGRAAPMRASEKRAETIAVRFAPSQAERLDRLVAGLPPERQGEGRSGVLRDLVDRATEDFGEGLVEYVSTIQRGYCDQCGTVDCRVVATEASDKFALCERCLRELLRKLTNWGESKAIRGRRGDGSQPVHDLYPPR